MPFYLAKLDPNEGMLVLVLVFAGLCFVASLIFVTLIWFAIYKITKFRPPYILSLVFSLIGFVAFALLGVALNRYASDLSYLQWIPYAAVIGSVATASAFMFWQKKRAA